MMRIQILLIIFFTSLLPTVESRSSNSANSEKKSSSKRKKLLDDFVSEYAWNNKKYYQYKIHGWTVYIEEILVNKKKKLGKKTFRKLKRDLRYVFKKLPETAKKHLQTVAIWVDFNTVQFPGGVYHPSATWLQANGFDINMADSLQIGVAQNYLTWTQHQPLMILHELSHAYHHQVLGYENQSIIDAYNAAVQSKKYENIQYYDGQTKDAYALTNVQEYFAETSEAYFGTNDYYPFNRKELKKHDPKMFNVLKQLWN